MFSPFPCSPVIRESLWKKTQIEQKKKKCHYTNSVLKLLLCLFDHVAFDIKEHLLFKLLLVRGSYFNQDV